MLPLLPQLPLPRLQSSLLRFQRFSFRRRGFPQLCFQSTRTSFVFLQFPAAGFPSLPRLFFPAGKPFLFLPKPLCILLGLRLTVKFQRLHQGGTVPFQLLRRQMQTQNFLLQRLLCIAALLPHSLLLRQRFFQPLMLGSLRLQLHPAALPFFPLRPGLRQSALQRLPHLQQHPGTPRVLSLQLFQTFRRPPGSQTGFTGEALSSSSLLLQRLQRSLRRRCLRQRCRNRVVWRAADRARYPLLQRLRQKARLRIQKQPLLPLCPVAYRFSRRPLLHIRLLCSSALFLRAAAIMQVSVQRFLRRCFPFQFHRGGMQLLAPCSQLRQMRRFRFLCSAAISALLLLFGQKQKRLLSLCIQGSQPRILFQAPFRCGDLHRQSLAAFVFPPGLFIVLPAAKLHRFQPRNLQSCFV